jgi:type IV secretory pathway TraG/TraD family ATPase VirD4
LGFGVPVPTGFRLVPIPVPAVLLVGLPAQLLTDTCCSTISLVPYSSGLYANSLINEFFNMSKLSKCQFFMWDDEYEIYFRDMGALAEQNFVHNEMQGVIMNET